MDQQQTPNMKQETNMQGTLMDGKRPIILALQGDPCSGKTTLANKLAKIFKCSTIRLDDILGVLYPPIKREDADALISQGFDLIAQIVETQISLGLSVIVDSPLARRSHLEKLLDMLTRCRNKNFAPPRLIIIECKPKTKYTWQMRFEQHSSSYHNKWYKPHTWPFDPEFSRDYTDDDDDIVVHPLVSKLVVNTSNSLTSYAIAAGLRDLIARGGGQQIEYEKWLLVFRQTLLARQEQDRLRANNNSAKGFCTTKPHNVKIYMAKGVDHDAICGVCENPVIQSGGGAYTCSNCPLAIHKSCAELADDDDDDGRLTFTPENFPKFLQLKPKAMYCFPEEHLCDRCEKESKEFSYKCVSCVFECHLKCRLVPTIVQHQAHEHALFFWANSISIGLIYECMACRRTGEHAGYNCVNRCMGYNFHAECLLLPPLVREHVHCGYAHDLEMIFKRDQELEDYICHLCFEQMNPDAWYYCCKICHLDLHLNCAFKEFM